MIPTSFEESNHVYDKPSNMSRDVCDALSVWKGTIGDQGMGVISCWKLTKEELEEINKTGRVWVYHYGDYLQPHYVGIHTPFDGK